MLHDAAWICRGLGELLSDGTARGVRIAKRPGLERDRNILTTIEGQVQALAEESYSFKAFDGQRKTLLEALSFKIGDLHVLNLVNVLGLECYRQGRYMRLLVAILRMKLEHKVGMTLVRSGKALEGAWGIYSR